MVFNEKVALNYVSEAAASSVKIKNINFIIAVILTKLKDS